MRILIYDVCSMSKTKMKVSSLEEYDPKRELEFETSYQLSLNTSLRYKRLMQMINQNNISFRKNERKKTTVIISRP